MLLSILKKEYKGKILYRTVLVPWALGLLFLIPTLPAQPIDLVYPEPNHELIHYKKLPDKITPQAAEVQEWRRKLPSNELGKGHRYVFNEQGKLSTIEIPGDIVSEFWYYSYQKDGRPKQITIVTNAGDSTQLQYTYYPDYYVRSYHSQNQLVEKLIFFFDNKKQLIERKFYAFDYNKKTLSLTERIVYTYNRMNKKTGEMHYEYYTDPDDTPKMMQWKRNFYYQPATWNLLRSTTSNTLSVRQDDIQPSIAFDRIVQTDHYSYNAQTGKLTEKAIEIATIGPTEKWTYQYKDGQLHQIKWEDYSFTKEVVSWSRQHFNEEGGVSGFEYHGADLFDTVNYRSSFVVQLNKVNP